VQRAAVGEQDAARADAQVARRRGDVADEHLGGGDRDGRERVVLGDPVAPEAERVDVAREREGVLQRVARRAAGAPRRLVEHGDRNHARTTYDHRTPDSRPRLAIGLTGGGWHPAAWREPGARPTELLTARWWIDQVGVARAASADLVTIEDALADPPVQDTGVVRGRLDAIVLAARIAPATRDVGLVPVVVTALTEPFHVSTQIATIDYVSRGRAGMLVRAGTSAWEAAHAGRRDLPPADALRAEAAEYVEVVRRLWDSWEDGAEIRDVERHRFIDSGKLHHIDFESERFRIRGPSITPRPPQGQPLVLATEPGVGADIVLHDLVVFLDTSADAAAQRRARLDALHPWSPEAEVFAGTAESLADLLAQRRDVRLLPAAIPHDLDAIARDLAPLLQARGLLRRDAGPGTLRERFGLRRPPSRYAA
jgi:alkanesulfonate monooxygenase SsuD/methylene tetrahydromethanopterin reductase-like flavin-dependent oxidoreductase (luciferase family)